MGSFGTYPHLLISLWIIYMDRCALASSSKLDFVKQKLTELSLTPAWSGQIEFAADPQAATRILIKVKNRFVRDWIRENSLPEIQTGMADLPGDEITLQILVQESAGESARIPARELPKSAVKAVSKKPETANLFHETLKQKYSFENFVVGSSNQFAHAAAKAVSKFPGRNYNPLFIYGGVGLGKTHLLNAIGLDILRSNPHARIVYLSSEKFMNELIHCIRFEKMGDFRKKYRDSCDVLLIDDIQFIAGKERTQEEFFHTFNHLYDLQKQIVLTSDKQPRDIPDLEERLRSRFEWGLLADIQIPDLETRIAILKKKSEDDHIPIEDDMAMFLASHIKSNVRELEGALIRLHAFASLNNVPLSIPLAKDVLKNILSNVDRILTVEQIQKTVADYYKIKLAELTGKRRLKSLALPRQVAMYLCRKHVKSSFPEIGHKFGGKDHSTVVHACSKILRVIGSDTLLREQIEQLEQSISR